MKCDGRAVFAGLALVLASCQGSGLDSGMGDMSPPVSQPGSIGGMNGGFSNGMNGQMAGPTTGPNGREELANPGARVDSPLRELIDPGFAARIAFENDFFFGRYRNRN